MLEHSANCLPAEVVAKINFSSSWTFLNYYCGRYIKFTFIYNIFWKGNLYGCRKIYILNASFSILGDVLPQISSFQMKVIWNLTSIYVHNLRKFFFKWRQHQKDRFPEILYLKNLLHLYKLLTKCLSFSMRCTLKVRKSLTWKYELSSNKLACNKFFILTPFTIISLELSTSK